MSDASLVWPVMSQLRTHLDEALYLQRTDEAIRGGYQLAIIEDAGTLVGAVGYRLLTDLCWGYTLYVDDLVVDEERRREGFGLQLMRYVEEVARRAGCNHIRLASGLSREAVHRFYEKIGYQRTSLQFTRSLTRE